MKKMLAGTMWILGAVAAMLMVGCVPVDYSYPQSYQQPYNASGASAAGTLQAAQFQATIAAEHAQAVQQTAEAGMYERAMQLTAQQGDFERQLTGTAVVQIAQQTQVAGTQQAEASATAWMITQTPMAATQQAVMLAAQKAANQASWQRVTEPMKEIVPVVLLVALGIMVLVGLVLVWPKAMRLMNVLERRASTIISPDGQVITYIPTDDAVHVVNPLQAFYPVTTLGLDSGTGSGGAPDELQNLQNARGQTVALAHTLQSKGSEGRKMLRAATNPGQQPQAPAAAPYSPVLDVEIVDADQVGGWVGEVEQKLLKSSGEEVL